MHILHSYYSISPCQQRCQRVCVPEMQTSIRPEFLEVLMRIRQTFYVALLHTIHQGMASRVKASASGSLVVGKLAACLFYTINIRSAGSTVQKPSSSTRSKTAFCAMTVVVTAAVSLCPDKPGSVVYMCVK